MVQITIDHRKLNEYYADGIEFAIKEIENANQLWTIKGHEVKKRLLQYAKDIRTRNERFST